MTAIKELTMTLNTMTKPRQRVLALLRAQQQALKPYDILKLLSTDGQQTHPPTVYRALDYLQTAGLVHKVESTGAFLACTHIGHTHHAILLLCDACGKVEEAHAPELFAPLDLLAQAKGFNASHTVVEIRGQCGGCQI